jgi:hypothetical protein
MICTSLVYQIGLAALLVAFPCGAGAAEWALLIGAEDYQKAAQLQFTVNDVQQLALTLGQYGGYEEKRVRAITDEGKLAGDQPLKASLEAALPEFLKQPQAGDSILVYFSGHGFKDQEGKLYLAPLDCDPANPVATGISAEWFRDQLAACQAGFKLLVLDSCHAGAEKGADIPGAVAAKDLGELFKASVGVVTLASSTADEKSQIWQYKQQSLFSYWLNQGLKGHADADSSGAVNIHELFEYVHDHVRQTAEIRLDRTQTPVLIRGSRVPGVPEVIRLRPQPLKQVVADMAEQLSGLMEERQLKSLGVVEFTNDSLAGETLGGEFGLLGRYCSERLEEDLIQQGAGKYSVVDRRRLQAALKEQRFSLESFGSRESLVSLSKTVGEMPVIAKGTLSERAGQIVHLRCKLLETAGDKALGQVGGVARISESEWAMLGRSVRIDPLDRMPVVPHQGEPPPPSESQTVIERADVRSQGAHPLLDPAFPYRVRMMVRGKGALPQERKPVFQGNDCFLPVREGEVYELWVENRSDPPQTVMMRLLVDGLNTLPEKETDKGVATYLVGKRVNLNEARPWELNPQARDATRIKNVPTWAVRGFVSETGTQGQLRDFLVVDVEQSLAARQQFTEQIGLITAAFYLPKGTTRRVGTGQGERRTENIRQAANTEVGNLIAVVNLRYVDDRALAGQVSGRR